MRKMCVQRRILWGAIMGLAQAWVAGQLAAATFEFSNPSSRLVLGDYNGTSGSSQVTSRFRTTAPNSVIGWDQQSIVRGSSTANVVSWAWTTSLGFATHSELTRKPALDGTEIVRGTSSWVNAKDALVRTSSNAVNVLGPVVRGTSQWVANNDTWIRGSSNAVNSQWPTLRTTSNWVAANGSVVRGTSNAVNNLFPIVRGNSQWIANNDGWIRGTSTTVNNLFPIVRGSSQWINNQYVALNNNAALARVVRTSSNWINRQFVDLAASNMGQILRGTTNWIYNQYVDLGNNAGLGRELRGTSNWVNAKDALVRTNSNAVNLLAPVVRGTSQWVANNDSWIRGSSNAVNSQWPTLRTTSNWVAANGGGVRGTSNAVNNLFPIVRGNSQWIVNNDSWIRGTSRTVNNTFPLLVATSNYVNAQAGAGGLNAVIRGNSQWIVNNDAWIRGTSKTVNNLFPIVRGNSQWVANNDSWIRGTSTTVNNIFPILRGNSQWVANNDSWIRGTSKTVNNLFPIVRGNSQWINNQYVALGNNAGMARELRTSSNWINRQFVDLGASNVGQILRGTTNWVNNQYVALDNNAALGYVARTSSNWINRQFVDLGASNVGQILRGTTNWVNNQYVALNNDAGLGQMVRTSSNLLVIVNDLALQAKGIAVKAQNSVTGLGQASAQNALDFTATTTAAFTYTSTGEAAVSQLADAAWHPTGNLMAFAHDFGGSGAISVNYYNGTFAQASVPYTGQGLAAGYIPRTLSWHPTGNRLVVGTDNREGTSKVYMYQYYSYDNGYLYNYNQNAITSSANGNSKVYQVAWSNDGRYYAVVGRSLEGSGDGAVKQIRVYKSDRDYYYYWSTEPTPVATYQYAADTDAYVSSVAWHPTDAYLLIGGSARNELRPVIDVLKFDGSSLTSALGSEYTVGAASDVVKAVAWDPTGAYLAVGGTFAQKAKLYEFVLSGGTAALSQSDSALSGFSLTNTSTINNVSWSRDGNFLSFAHNGVSVHSFKTGVDGALAISTIENVRGFANPINSVDWSTDGRYFAIAGKNVTGDGKDLVLKGLKTDLKVSSLGDGSAGIGDTLRTTSNWVNAQAQDLGSNRTGYYLRTTSNAMNRYALGQTNDPDLVRTTSNWVNKQFVDLGASTVGAMLRGTTNWVNNQYIALGNNAAMGRELRTSSNWINKQYADLGASTVGAMLRGTSNALSDIRSDINNYSGVFGTGGEVISATGRSIGSLIAYAYDYNVAQARDLDTLQAWRDSLESYAGLDSSVDIGKLIRATSNWVVGNNPLVRATSNAVNAQFPILRTTSNWVSRYSPVVQGTSQWVANNDSWLRGTSKTVNNLFPIVRGSSQWVANNDSWLRGTSKTVNNLFPILRGNSQWVANNDSWIRGTSKTVNNLFPIVRGSSQWIANNDSWIRGASTTVNNMFPILRGSSQWVANNDSWIRGTSTTVNNLFPIVRGSSQWVANNDSWIRGTSTTVNNMFPILRGSSQWVANNDSWIRGTSKTVNNLFPIVRGSSQWINNQYVEFGNNAALGKELRTASNFVNAHWSTLRTTSNWVNAKDEILRTTSNAVAGGSPRWNAYAEPELLRTTSNFVNAHWPTLRTTSNWVNRYNDVVRGTSQWVSNNDGWIRATSQLVSNNDSWIRGTSKTVNNLFPIVRGTSQWISNNDGWIRATSQLVSNNDSWIRGTSKTVNNLFPIVRGTSQWISNQYAALGNAAMGQMVRTTSNVVNTYWPLVRTNSNWINKQFVDLGASNVGQILRGTSKWVNNQYVALNNDAGLATLVRTTSNTLMYEHRRLGSVEGDLIGIHQDLKSVDIGSGNVAITGSSFTAHYDLSANTDNVIEFHDSTSFDGNGNRITFARGKTDTMYVSTGSFVTLRDTVLQDFDDTAVKVGARAQLTFGNGTVIELGHDTKLNRDWVCTGNVVIKGYGSKIDLNGHKITIGRDTRGQQGSLVMEDIVLDGVKTGCIVPDGANATVTLRDADMNLADTMDFSKGTLRAERNVTLSGQNIFSFTSTGKLAVAANSTLVLDANTSFVYAPSNGSRTSLALEDATSQLVLNGCFFYAPAPGVQLTTGILVVKSNNNLYNTGAQSLDEAITFGDGTLAGDLLIDLQPGASLNIIEGKVDYQNGKN